jgi:hypothetical protein
LDRQGASAKQSQFPRMARRGTGRHGRKRTYRWGPLCQTKPIFPRVERNGRGPARLPAELPRDPACETKPILQRSFKCEVSGEQSPAASPPSLPTSHFTLPTCETNPIPTEHEERQMLSRERVMMHWTPKGLRQNKANFRGCCLRHGKSRRAANAATHAACRGAAKTVDA